MRAFYAPETEGHAPNFFLMRGTVVPNEERAARAARLLEGLARLNIAPDVPARFGREPLLAVHTERYVTFVNDVWDTWSGLPTHGPEVVGNVQPRRAEASYPQGIVGRAGWHMGDLACPIGPHTALAVQRAADTALAAAEAVNAGAPAAYALARPPGHHASAEVAGGHCIFNNSAIAAAYLTGKGRRTAVVDIDVHHGNGTQAIFYDQADVLTVSVHTDPSSFYPWFTGHAHERGEGPGEGANINLPLPMGAGDKVWLPTVKQALDAAADWGADHLVLALGLDVHEGDPLSGMNVTTDGIAKAAELVRGVGLPTVIVQEGGYLGPSLSDNIHAFLAAYQGVSR